MILGKIASVGGGVALIIDGETTPTTKKYLFLSSYSPAVNDRVLIEEISGTYVVLGKVTDTASGSGTTAERVAQYSNAGHYVEFTYFNSNLWAKIDGDEQFALRKG